MTIKATVIIQDPTSGTTLQSGVRVVSGVSRDVYGNETGIAKFNGVKYVVTRTGNGAFYG